MTRPIPTAAELRLPAELVETVFAEHSGLILITGPTGSGKTHTAYSLADMFNLSRSGVIYSVTDVSELKFSNGWSLVVERVAGEEPASLGESIRQGLRLRSDVILIDDIRDDYAAREALHAANTGHLVIATMHAGSATEAVKRLVALTGAAQEYARRSAAEALLAVSHQTLEKSEAGLTPTFKTVTDRTAIRRLIGTDQPSTAHTCPHCGHAL